MKNFKQLFCKHNYKPMMSYTMIGWEQCLKCGKKKYTGEDTEFTYFKFPDLYFK